MKLVSAAALLLATTGISAANVKEGSVRVIDNFLTSKEAYDYIAATEMLLEPVLADPRASFRGQVKVDKAFQRRVQSTLGTEFVPNVTDPEGSDDIMVQTRLVYQSTRPHVDVYKGTGEIVQDSVAFVFLTDNDEAKFNYGGITIPAVAGRLVTFPGSVMHGTTLNKGNVHLLGPFSVKNFAGVGDPCRDPDVEEGCVPKCDEGESVKSYCVADPCTNYCGDGPHDHVEICIQNGLHKVPWYSFDGASYSSVTHCVPEVAAQILIGTGNAECGSCDDCHDD